LKAALSSLFFTATLATAQVPRAEPVDPALVADAPNARYQRAVNLFDTANASTVPETRVFQFQQASVLFSNYIQDFPNHPNAEKSWWYLGTAYYQSGQLEEAKRCFHTLLNRHPNGVWAAAAAFNLASDHYSKGEYAFAAPLFERFAANASRPEDRPRGHYLAGTCYRMLERDREAIVAFNKVLADPAAGHYVPQSKLALGNLNAKVGRHEEALVLFEEIISSTQPAKFRGEAAVKAAFSATQLGRTDVAELHLRGVLASPGMEEFHPDAQTALMANHYAKKEYQQVIDLFRRSSLKAEGQKEAARLMYAARSLLKLDKPTEASALFREIERIVPPETDLAFHASYYRLLCFFKIEGKHVPDQVDAFLQIYRKTRPKDTRIHTALMMKAESLFSNKENAAAARVYNEIDAAAVSDANRPGLLYQRGWCLAEAGDAQGAIRSFSEFIAKYPDDSRVPSALAKRAKAYADTGEIPNAIIDFDRLTAEGMPDNLASFAWLESARMRRAEGNIDDMVIRYRGLLGNVADLSEKLQAEANYWIGWGLVKTNRFKEAVTHLQSARSMRPEAYRKHAGILLALGHYAAQAPEDLAGELNLAIEGEYIDDIPDQTLRWAGNQAYNAADFASAARFLQVVSTPDEPRETPKEVWRYLAKSLLEIDRAEEALTAVTHVLEVEENPSWKADGLLDKGRALLLLKRAAEARIAADEAMALNPQGRTSAGLNYLSGDLFLAAENANQAAVEFLKIVNFSDDKDLKPRALQRLIDILEAQGKTDEAAKYRDQLKREFPAWKPR
jgi:tetratricopeptide (TPR) repeat protein